MKVDYIECGDCLELIKNIPDQTVDIVLTSPPYNMTKRKGGYADKVKRYDFYNDWKEERDYIEWMVDVFKEIDRVLKSNGVILFNFSYSIENPILPYKLICEIDKQTDFTIADTISWKKNNCIPFPANKCRLSRLCEYVFVIVRKKEINSFKTNKAIKKIGKNGQKYYEVFYNYIEARNNDGTNPYNKATFSSEFVCKLLDMYSSNENDVVLDPFIETGTTALACVKSNRHYIGFEISETQFKLAEERIKNHQVQQTFY